MGSKRREGASKRDLVNLKEMFQLCTGSEATKTKQVWFFVERKRERDHLAALSTLKSSRENKVRITKRSKKSLGKIKKIKLL